ncbi:MAG: triacylglycerol lipase [Litorilituus sp.]|jgi:triacylglycerol lipase|nr:triacylglycerol lipase [Litorilituus sp.]
MRICLYVALALLVNLYTPSSAQAQATKYPVVLVHGFLGFDDILGIDYFYRIPNTLRQQGTKVFVAQVSAFNSTEMRGEQLRAYVQAVLAQTGAEKVNLIGHSHGGPTSRYVASLNPEMVASVTSVGGVNWGSGLADVLRGAVPVDSWTEALIVSGFDALGVVINFASGGDDFPTDGLGMTHSLTTVGTIEFNETYPEGVPEYYCGEGEEVASNGVHYYSWSGGSPTTNIFDASDAALALTSLAFSNSNEANDGAVSICSSHLGKVIKDDYKMNHLDEINHLFGLVSWWETNPEALYRNHVNNLASMGL